MLPISNTTIDNVSIFRRINPSVKFIVFILAVFMFFVPSGFFGQSILVVVVITSLALARLSKKTYLGLLKTYIVMLVMFILLNWFTMKFPIVAWMDGSNYQGIGTLSNWLLLNPADYGYTSNSIQFTESFGNVKIASLDQLKMNVQWLSENEAKTVSKWFNSLDKDMTAKLLDYFKTALPGFDDKWYQSYLYALNNEYVIDGVKWKVQLASNAPIAESINDLVNHSVYQGVAYNFESMVTYSAKWYSISPLAFFKAWHIANKVTMIISSSIILTATTSPAELTNGIEKLFSPLKIVKFPANECALILSIGIRFIPSLLIESRRILNAQASRGLDFYNGNLWIKIRSLISLIIPLFSISITRSSELANAMEARGFNPRAERTKYHIIQTTYFDYIYLFILFLCMFLQLFLWVFNFIFLPFGIIEVGLVF